MSFQPNRLPPIQDIAPKGGFAVVDLSKELRVRGVSGASLWIGSTLLIVWGMYRIGQSNRDRGIIKLNEREEKYLLGLYLQCEENKRYRIRQTAILEKEAQIMKDVPGWVVGESTYHTKRWVQPKINHMSSNN